MEDGMWYIGGMHEGSKIKRFTDLEAWKAAHRLAIDIYATTKKFPKDEQFGIISQMRRSAVSIGSNIAEGFSRHTTKDKSYFYSIAKGSATELENQLLLSRDVGFLPNSDFQTLEPQLDRVGRLITGLLKFLRSQT